MEEKTKLTVGVIITLLLASSGTYYGGNLNLVRIGN